MLQDLSVSVSCRLYVSVLQAQTLSHVADYKVFRRLSQYQCVVCINICKCFAGCHNVNVLQAVTVSVCCTH